MDEITLQEASALYGYDRATLFRWIKSGKIEGIEVRKGSRTTYKIRKADIEACLKSVTSKDDVESLTEAWKIEQANGFHTGKPLAPRRIINNAKGLSNFWKHCGQHKKIQNITADNLRTALSSIEIDHEAKRDYAAKKETMFHAVCSFSKLLARRNLAPASLLGDLKTCKPKRVYPPRKTVLKEDQLMALIELNQKWTNGRSTYCRALTNILLYLFAFAGLRRNEARNLRLPYIDLANGIIHVIDGKGHKNRPVGICPELAEHLQTWLQHYRPASTLDYLLLDKTGNALPERLINDRIQHLAAKAKIDITPHGLRRTFATLMENRGMPWSLIQLALGHSDIKTTQKYVMSDVNDMVSWLRGWNQHEIKEPPQSDATKILAEIKALAEVFK